MPASETAGTDIDTAASDQTSVSEFGQQTLESSTPEAHQSSEAGRGHSHGMTDRQDSASYQRRPPSLAERQDSASNLQVKVTSSSIIPGMPGQQGPQRWTINAQESAAAIGGAHFTKRSASPGGQCPAPLLDKHDSLFKAHRPWQRRSAICLPGPRRGWLTWEGDETLQRTWNSFLPPQAVQVCGLKKDWSICTQCLPHVNGVHLAACYGTCMRSGSSQVGMQAMAAGHVAGISWSDWLLDSMAQDQCSDCHIDLCKHHLQVH